MEFFGTGLFFLVLGLQKPCVESIQVLESICLLVGSSLI